MKHVLPTLLAMACTVTLLQADIHMPPAADHGPTRKLGRGLSNLVFGVTELPYQIANINHRHGNSAASGYGVTRGIGRTVRRWRYGLQEILLFPFPVQKGTYEQPYLSEDLWLTAGFQEFPPELGWESKYKWCR